MISPSRRNTMLTVLSPTRRLRTSTVFSHVGSCGRLIVSRFSWARADRPEHRLQHQVRRARRPRLGRARDRVAHGAVRGPAREPAEQLGQPEVVGRDRRVEQRGRDAVGRPGEPVPLQPGRDQRVVVRPDRTVVVAHRVVGGRGPAHRPDAPAREHVRRQQPLRERQRLVLVHDPGVQAVAGVGHQRSELLLVGVERGREVPLVLHPERLVEAHLQAFRLVLQARRVLGPAERAVHVGHPRLREVDVPLHLRERDRGFGEPPVGVDHRVVRVLPPLVADPAGRAAQVLDEPVAVQVAVPVDPGERGLRVGQELAREPDVAGPPQVLGVHDQEPRRRVHRPVVGRVRHDPRARELAVAHLVQDLARLLVAPVVLLRALARRQELEGIARRPRVHRQQLVRGDQRVAAEDRHVPRDPGGEDRAVPHPRVQRAQVAQAAVQELVEQLVVGDDPRRLALPLLVRATELVHRVVEVRGRVGRLGPQDRFDRDRDEPRLVRVEVEPEDRRGERPVDVDALGVDAEADPRDPPDVIAPLVHELDRRSPSPSGGWDPPEWRWVIPRTSKMSAKSAPNVSPTSRVTSNGL